jgi:hypothetical protein
MEDKEQKIKIQFDTNAEETSKKVDGLTGKLEATAKTTDKVATSQKKAIKSTKDLGGGIEDLGGPIGGAISGFKALLAQMFAIVANPIGAVLAVIVGAVALLGKAFFSTQANGDKLGKGLAVISGLFSGLLKVLEPVATFLVDNIIKSFETAGNVILSTSLLLQKGLRALGLDAAANGLKGLTDAVDSNVKASNKLADAEAKLVSARRNAQQTQLDFQNKAEKIRQKRDNDSNLSIAERSKLNAQLAVVLKEQSLEELKIANLAKTVSDLRIKQEGKSSANLDERAEALLQISDINERISGQESEQLANANSLRNEQKALDKEAAAAKAAADKVIEDARLALLKEGIDKENSLQIANEDLLDKTDEQKLARLKTRADEEVEVLKQKGIDTVAITILNAEKFATLERDLAQKRIEENKVIFDKESDEKVAAAKDLADKEVEIERAKLQQKREIQEQGLNLAGQAVAFLAQVFGKSKKVQKAAMIAEGAVAVGKQVAATNTSIVGALATPQAIATGGVSAIPVIALNAAQGAIGVASTIASTKKALQSLGGGSIESGSGTSGGARGAGAAGATPQVAFQASSENQIGNTVANNLNSQPPIQAYVVSKSVTDAQQLDNNKINSNSI